MKDTIAMGAQMWLILRPAFDEAMTGAGFADHKEHAQVWAAFLAAAAGSMMNDIGKPDALTVLDGVIMATRETSHLMVVPKR